MHIFFDESGSFVPSDKEGSWCVVAAYVIPERGLANAERALLRNKRRIAGRTDIELKLGDFDEPSYIRFLRNLVGLEGILFCTAVDAGRHSANDISAHHKEQVTGIVRYKDVLTSEEGRTGLQKRADEFAKLSPQLYLQLTAQFETVYQVIEKGRLYFVQRDPSSLGKFRWRIDEKNAGTSLFEKSFEDFAAAMCQSRSLSVKSISLIDADYSHFARFEYAADAPNHLRDVYGLDVGNGRRFKVGMVMREDFAYEDSKESLGIQIADLLASGLRRCLRGEYKVTSEVPQLLGHLMTNGLHDAFPISLISLTADGPAEDIVKVANVFRQNVRPLIQKTGRI